MNTPINKTAYIVAAALLTLVVVAVAFTLYFLHKPSRPLSILWAEFPPGEAFITLTESFTKETGIPVEVTLVPWGEFQTVAYRDVDKTHPEFDIIIGDSQWLGRNVERGERYLDLTSFIKKNNIEEVFSPDIVSAYGEYPPESKRHYAVPMLVDPMGFAYRKDWFEDKKEQAAFRTRYGYELSVPRTWEEVHDIAEFFHRPSTGVQGISMLTSSGYDALAMTFGNVLYAFGGDIGSQETHVAEGYINSNASVRALEFFAELYQFSAEHADGDPEFSAPDRPTNTIKEGRVALALNYFSLLDPLFDASPGFDPETIGYFTMPAGSAGRFASLGGQGASIVYRSNNQRVAKKFLRWMLEPQNSNRWMELTGTAAHVNRDSAETDQEHARSAIHQRHPYNEALTASYPVMRDFWVASEYPELLDASQRQLYIYLTGKGGTAQETLDTLAGRWDSIFETSPYNILRE